MLSGQPEQEPRWKRAAHIIDGAIGEALGQLYVEKYFPPEAKARMNDLVENLKGVFHDRLEKVSWMTERHARQGAGQVRALHPENRLSGQIPRLLGIVIRPRRSAGQCPARRGL